MSDDGGDESDGSWAEVIEEETGKTYYFNEGTGATQWHHPYGSDSDEEGEGTSGGTGGAGAGGGSGGSTGSAEWDEVADKASGKTYWFNAATGESTWTRPGSGGAGAPSAGLQYEYLDSNGGLQGPYSDTEMRNWYSDGYFRSDLKVRGIARGGRVTG